MTSKVLVIVGPTASGKKKLSLKAAEQFNGEIVSADSRKVYRYLDIGTAKPSPEERNRVPHHLIDIVDPDEAFSAGEWVKRASPVVKDIIARGRLPMLSGGTGFYIKAFQEGLSDGISPDPEVRKNLDEELDDLGPSAMYRKLSELDPVRASELHENDTFRVIRALEIYYTTGSTITALRNEGKNTGGDYEYFSIGLTMPREMLYRRIDERADNMVANGVADELKNVLDMGYPRELPSLNTVGYKEWFPWLDGTESFERCLEDMKRNTRRYAKRQLTWFKAQPDIHWIDGMKPAACEETLGDAEKWLTV